MCIILLIGLFCLSCLCHIQCRFFCCFSTYPLVHVYIGMSAFEGLQSTWFSIIYENRGVLQGLLSVHSIILFRRNNSTLYKHHILHMLPLLHLFGQFPLLFYPLHPNAVRFCCESHCIQCFIYMPKLLWLCKIKLLALMIGKKKLEEVNPNDSKATKQMKLFSLSFSLEVH